MPLFSRRGQVAPGSRGRAGPGRTAPSRPVPSCRGNVFITLSVTQGRPCSSGAPGQSVGLAQRHRHRRCRGGWGGLLSFQPPFMAGVVPLLHHRPTAAPSSGGLQKRVSLSPRRPSVIASAEAGVRLVAAAQTLQRNRVSPTLYLPNNLVTFLRALCFSEVATNTTRTSENLLTVKTLKNCVADVVGHSMWHRRPVAVIFSLLVFCT